MANTSSRLVKSVVASDNSDYVNNGFDVSSTASLDYKIASIDNDCKYKVYPLVEDTSIGGDLPKEANDRYYKIMTDLIALGLEPAAAARSTW